MMETTVNIIIKLLEDKNEKWEFTEYHAIHPKSGLALWIANGWLSIETCPNKICPNFFQKYYLWKAYKIAVYNLINRKMLVTLTSPQKPPPLEPQMIKESGIHL